MSSRTIRLIAILCTLALPCTISAQTHPTTLPRLPANLRPVEDKLDIPSLVREARAKEAWINDIQTFRATYQWTCTHSPEQVKQRTAELLERNPKADLSPARNPELRPSNTTRIDIAFDQKRYSIEGTELDLGTWSRDAWDGQVTHHEAKTAADAQPTSMTGGKPASFRLLLATFSCFRTADRPERYGPAEVQLSEDYFGRPEDFQLAGRTTYHGTDCYLLVCPASHRRWYIGVSDHRIYGVLNEENTSATPQERQQIIQQVIAEKAGRAMTDQERSAWLDSLPREQRSEIAREIGRRTYPQAIPAVEDWVRDYKEIAPGVFFPMTHGKIIHDSTGTTVRCSREGTIAEVEINQPLPEDLW